MGLLDDAIKEHLELKRKHGAAEDDLRRQETEALGPARRDFAAGDVDPEPAVARPAEPEPLEPAAQVVDPAPAPPAPPVAEPPPPRRVSQTPTEGFPALRPDDEPEAGDEEDVLEETPDFLQDTPEHDRLWFEQKPPRDFDFDG